MTAITLSVAILTRDRRKDLERCLRSLARQRHPPEEVLVLDTGSRDGTREWLESLTAPGAADSLPSSLAPLAGRLRWMEDSGEGAFAGARNRAAAAARGEVIAFLDDDCEAGAGWAGRLRRRFEADPDLAALGGVTLPARELPFPESWPPEMNWLLGLSPPGCWGPEAGRVHLAQAANLAFRRAVWEAAPFETPRPGAGFASGGKVYDAGREDADWWRGLRRRGLRAEMDGRLIAWHRIDPARLRWATARDRARRDGRTQWRRDPSRAFARAAISDLIHEPLRFFEYLARPGVTPRQASVFCALWGERQAAALRMALSDRKRGVTPGEALRIAAAEAARLAAGVAKTVARLAAREANRRLRRVAALPVPERPPRALLLVACGFLGDQLLIQPALRLLRAAYPETRLVLLTGGFGEELYGPEAPAPDREIVDHVINAQRWGRGAGALWRRHEALRRALLEIQPGATLIFYAHGLWPLPLFTVGEAPVLGFDRDMGFSQRLWTDLLTVQVVKSFSLHECQNHARLAGWLGAGGELAPFCLTIPGELQDRMDAALAAEGLAPAEGGSGGAGRRPFIAVHMDTGLPYKEWPIERWIEVIRWIERETPCEVALIGGRAARPAVEEIRAAGLRARDFRGRLSLRATAALLRRARLLVSGDSGPKHLAFAVGAPTLTLYGPSDERRWGALWDRERHHAVRRGLHDLTGEDLRGLPDNWAMLLLEPADVIRALEDRLATG